MQYKFYFLLSFDLWTFYFEKILFLMIQRYSTTYVLKFPNFTRIFNCQLHSFLILQGYLIVIYIVSKCGKNSLMFQNLFSYNDSLFILTTQEKKSWWYLMTYYFLCLGIFKLISWRTIFIIWVLFYFHY
jgi:hypothetical protein